MKNPVLSRVTAGLAHSARTHFFAPNPQFCTFDFGFRRLSHLVTAVTFLNRPGSMDCWTVDPAPNYDLTSALRIVPHDGKEKFNKSPVIRDLPNYRSLHVSCRTAELKPFQGNSRSKIWCRSLGA